MHPKKNIGSSLEKNCPQYLSGIGPIHIDHPVLTIFSRCVVCCICRDVVFRENKTKQHNFNFDGTHDIFFEDCCKDFFVCVSEFTVTN